MCKMVELSGSQWQLAPHLFLAPQVSASVAGDILLTAYGMSHIIKPHQWLEHYELQNHTKHGMIQYEVYDLSVFTT